MLCSVDIGTAFLQGMTYKEVASKVGETTRNIGFMPPKGSSSFIRELPGFSQFNEHKHCIKMLKSIYGLKDAPRMWRKKLDEV